ncbi:helix-turn-helix transcriptional regulator [Sphingobacterium sp. BIGb0116]|uniref:helix-turn-helix domain-containing protein n=1 Tax=Sphingobacterium sp. BIGb0116 TaxID=2940619 RepID=UPI002167EF05|nr:helix-turn-helix transcriptional regulator [Sphingobacterium sp. BIGb0116]MCS4165188.1 transcriptional regulator with XRE-family HTH domain [Sphingobacterium sp. BIGb0116]
MDINKLTASHIKDIRNKLGYTIEYVAEKLDIANSTYSSFENGHTEITLKRIVALAQVFDMPWTDLLPVTNNTQTFNGHNGLNGNYNTNPTLNNFFSDPENISKTMELIKDVLTGNKK